MSVWGINTVTHLCREGTGLSTGKINLDFNLHFNLVFLLFSISFSPTDRENKRYQDKQNLKDNFTDHFENIFSMQTGRWKTHDMITTPYQKTNHIPQVSDEPKYFIHTELCAWLHDSLCLTLLFVRSGVKAPLWRKFDQTRGNFKTLHNYVYQMNTVSTSS